jgi:hypothetical protein
MANVYNIEGIQGCCLANPHPKPIRVLVPLGFVKPLTRSRENPCPYVRVRVFTGTGTGWLQKPQGCPWYYCILYAEDLPMPLRRRQFPVRLAFAMTVNKSQGQSLKHIGLALQSPVFSHGQLYVGLSRCRSGNRVNVLLKEADEGRIPNIVYKEVLTGLQL